MRLGPPLPYTHSACCLLLTQQVRDEYRMDYDSGRGGYGNILQKEMESRQAMMNTMADEMNYGAMGGFVGAEHDHDMDEGAGRQPSRFRGDSDDER